MDVSDLSLCFLLVFGACCLVLRIYLLIHTYIHVNSSKNIKIFAGKIVKSRGAEDPHFRESCTVGKFEFDFF